MGLKAAGVSRLSCFSLHIQTYSPDTLLITINAGHVKTLCDDDDDDLV